MIGTTMLTYALFTGTLRDAGLKPHTVTAFMDSEVASIEDSSRSLRIETRLEISPSIKKSPRYGWEFTHVSSGYGQARAGDSLLLRFRTLAQDSPTIQTMGHDANRLLLRLWDYNLNRLKVEHQNPYQHVDVYLAKGGDRPGGEHGLMPDADEKDNNGQDRAASVIHIFQIAGLTDKIEAVRELAHEYGHAVFPAVGTFDAPESWGNGYAAERIYLKWLHDDLKAKKLTTVDTMGAGEGDFVRYLAAKVDPLVKRMGLNGPDMTLLRGRSKEAFEEYLALNSYAEAILPRAAFARALKLGTSDENAAVFARAVVAAAEEREELNITIPPVLKGSPIWVPISKGVIKGAKVLERKGDWAKVQPTSATVIIVNPPVD